MMLNLSILWSPKQNMAHDVFISYSSIDRDSADAVCSILEENGISCWMAPRNITPDWPYAEALIDGIKSSEYLYWYIRQTRTTLPRLYRKWTG